MGRGGGSDPTFGMGVGRLVGESQTGEPPPTPDPTESSGRQPDPPPTRFSFSPERGGGAKEIFAFCDFGPFIPLEPGRIGWSGQGDQLAGLEGLAVRSSSAAITHP